MGSSALEGSGCEDDCADGIIKPLLVGSTEVGEEASGVRLVEIESTAAGTEPVGAAMSGWGGVGLDEEASTEGAVLVPGTAVGLNG